MDGPNDGFMPMRIMRAWRARVCRMCARHVYTRVCVWAVMGITCGGAPIDNGGVMVLTMG